AVRLAGRHGSEVFRTFVVNDAPSYRAAVVHEHYVSPSDRDVLQPLAVGRVCNRRQAERERQSVLGRPFDFDYRLLSQTIDALSYMGQQDGMTMRRIGIGRLSSSRADDLFEDEHVAGTKAQPAFRLRAPVVAVRRIALIVFMRV